MAYRIFLKRLTSFACRLLTRKNGVRMLLMMLLLGAFGVGMWQWDLAKG